MNNNIEIIVIIVLAFLGYIFTYLHELRNNRRKERLDLINRQINELYGPMFAITQTGSKLIKALRMRGGANGASYDAPKSSEDISNWRIWVEEVFVPRNQQLADIIINNAYLIREEKMPNCLKDFLLHHEGYVALIKKWDLGDFSESVSLIDYPPEIYEYASKTYNELKREQSKIIGMNK